LTGHARGRCDDVERKRRGEIRLPSGVVKRKIWAPCGVNLHVPYPPPLQRLPGNTDRASLPYPVPTDAVA
jgi:hypothetical protein